LNIGIKLSIESFCELYYFKMNLVFLNIKVYESIENTALSVFIAPIPRVLELDLKHAVII